MVVALLTCLVLASTAAGASTFISNQTPASISASSLEVEFLLDATTTECDASLAGTLASPSETLSISPTFTNCSAFGFLSATVNVNGCEFVLHGGEETEAETVDGTVDFTCPGSQKIVITAGTCEVQIGSQSGLSLIEFTNKGSSPRTVTASFNLAGLKYNKTKDGFGCPLSGTGEGSAGKFEGIFQLAVAGGGDLFVAAVETTLCKVNEDPCPGGNIYLTNTEFKASAKPGPEITISSKKITVACEESTLEGKTIENQGAANLPLRITFPSITFKGCTANAEPCAQANAAELPTTGGPVVGASPDGSMWVPLVLDLSCGKVLKCRFVRGAVEPSFRGGANAKIKAENTPLISVPVMGEVGCANATWTSTYTVSKPAPAYLSG